MVARLHHRAGDPQRAIETLEGHMFSHLDTTDLTHINMLGELYMSGVRSVCMCMYRMRACCLVLQGKIEKVV